jgi:hypothetical protein
MGAFPYGFSDVARDYLNPQKFLRTPDIHNNVASRQYVRVNEHGAQSASNRSEKIELRETERLT